jgi:hypothetical protein
MTPHKAMKNYKLDPSKKYYSAVGFQGYKPGDLFTVEYGPVLVAVMENGKQVNIGGQAGKTWCRGKWYNE